MLPAPVEVHVAIMLLDRPLHAKGTMLLSKQSVIGGTSLLTPVGLADSRLGEM